MPHAPQSPARSRVTDVVARVFARAMDVATTNTETALHCYTDRGEVTVIVPARIFADAARGKRDCNGNPFPVFTRQEKTLDEVMEPAVAAPLTGLSCERRIELRALWHAYIADPKMKITTAAVQAAWTVSHIKACFAAFASEPGAPAVKPNGKLA